MSEDTQPRYNPMFEDACSQRKQRNLEQSQQLQLANRNQSLHYSLAFTKKPDPACCRITGITCNVCGAWIRYTWFHRLLHRIQCTFSRLFKRS